MKKMFNIMYIVLCITCSTSAKIVAQDNLGINPEHMPDTSVAVNKPTSTCFKHHERTANGNGVKSTVSGKYYSPSKPGADVLTTLKRKQLSVLMSRISFISK